MNGGVSAKWILGSAILLCLPAGPLGFGMGDEPVANRDDPRCVVDCADTEGEPCGTATNWGCCCYSPPTFSPLAVGNVVCGNVWYDGVNRDTDWYELVLTDATVLRVTGRTEFEGLFGLVQTDPPGSGDCSQMTGLLDPYALTTPCEPFEIEIALDAGVWWFHMEPRFVTERYACDAGPGPDQQWTYTFEIAPATGACCLDDAPYCSETLPGDCPGTFLGEGTRCDGPDTDGDGRIDACDGDIDNDGVPNRRRARDPAPANVRP